MSGKQSAHAIHAPPEVLASLPLGSRHPRVPGRASHVAISPTAAGQTAQAQTQKTGKLQAAFPMTWFSSKN